MPIKPPAQCQKHLNQYNCIVFTANAPFHPYHHTQNTDLLSRLFYVYVCAILLILDGRGEEIGKERQAFYVKELKLSENDIFK